MKKIPLAVVIVTYNGGQYIHKCLSSLSGSSIPTRIIVVDNNSNDNTIDILRSDFPEVEIMLLSKNLGFGKANNIGIKYAFQSGAEHIFLLNQDAFVNSDALEELITLQKSNNDFVLFSPLQLNGDGSKLDYKFGVHLSKSFNIGQILSDSIIFKNIKRFYEVEFVNAAAWLLSRTAVKEIGLFNPVFEHYGEDFEYLHRIHIKGFKVGLSTKAIAYHDRDQNKIDSIKSKEKTLLHESAWIRYRLCQKNSSIISSILSVVKRAIIATHPDPLQKVIIRSKLIVFILKDLRYIIKMRNKGYSSSFAFFKDTPEFKRHFTTTRS